jgi:predicted amidohydrolase
MKKQNQTALSRREFLVATGMIGYGVQLGLGETESAAPKKPLAKITVAQVKVYPVKRDLQGNHEKLMAALSAIEKDRKVDVAVTPEGFLDGYVSKDKQVCKEDMIQYAIDPKTSTYTRAAAAWAKRNRAWLIYGCIRNADRGVYNTALIFNREGKLFGMYDKVHLQSHDLKYLPGNHLNVYDSDFGTFGVMICADRRWPETSRTLTLKGARVIFNPTYGFHNDLNICMMRTRAYENGIYIIFTHPGQSLITGPRGEVVMNNDDPKKSYTITEIDLDRATATKNNHIRDRRPDIYKL